MFRALYKLSLHICTLLLILLIGGAFTPFPHRLRRWLQTSVRSGVNPTHTMVVLGGGGIPSKSGLLRCYAAAELYEKEKPKRVIVALPSDHDPDITSTGRMRAELILRGVPQSIIEMESKGRNTAEQAMEVAQLVGEDGLFQSVLIVTDPSHMRRSMLCFKKAGFIDLKTGPTRIIGPEADLGPRTVWRYGFWNNLQLEIECLREVIALQYYKHKGWI